ncbi:glycosyltransferase family 4 protein [Rothia terrae]|uniref:glycosyltransferase family 4 protein n=1 Tax=Rothia terrae TaxID=396015 RepID=UPI00340B012F
MITPSRLVGNAVLVGRIGIQHLVDDPALFAVNIVRKMPHSVGKRVASAMTRTPVIGVRAVGEQALGVRELSQDARAYLQRPTQNFVQRLNQRLVAEAAVAYGAVDVQDGRLPTVTRARAAWDAGQVSEAIALAESDAAAKTYAARLCGEQEILNPDFTVPVCTAHHTLKGDAVLHILTNSLPATQSGYTLRTHRLLSALAQAGVKLHAMTRIGYPVIIGNIFAAATTTVDNITYQRLLPMRLGKTQPDRLHRWAQSIAEHCPQSPRLIHTTTNFHNALVTSALAKAWGIPWIYEVRGILEETWLSRQPEHRREAAASSERFELMRARETQMMHDANAVVTLSQTMKDSLVERGVEAQKIYVVPNAVDYALFELNKEPAEARAELGLPEAFWVGSVSSLVAYEGFDTLLRAVALVRSRGVNVRLLLAGDGAARNSLEALADELGIAEHVVFLGRVAPEQAYAAHQALDAFIVPRRNDEVCRSVTPLKPIEAMALQRPVIVSDIPPLTELIENGLTGRTGLAAEPENAQDFARQIEVLATDAKLRRDLATEGRIFAHSRTWHANAQILSAIYDGLAPRAD